MVPEVRHRLHQVQGLITLGESDRLAALAAEVPGWGTIVEIGAHTGRSTLWLAAGSQGAHVVTVDPWPEPGYTAHYEQAKSDDDPFEFGTGQAVMDRFVENLNQHGAWERITALRMPSLEAARVWVNPIGLLFLDAMHGYEDVRADCEAWLPKVSQGGVVALHDWFDDKELTHPSQVADAFTDVAGDEWEPLEMVDNLYAARRL